MASEQTDDRLESALGFLERQLELLERGFSFSGYERDLLALNQRDGRFLDISGVSGVDSIGDGRAAVYADFDNDGDLDIFLKAMHGPAQLLFHNRVGQQRRWLRLALEGRQSGRDAYGTVVRVHSTRGVQTRVKLGGSGFLSQSDPRLLFGLGDDEQVAALEVVWPSGLSQRFERLESNRSWLLVEGEPELREFDAPPIELPAPWDEERARWLALTLEPGQPLPALELETLAGARLPLSEALPTGRPVLVNLWASWCAGCRDEMPELQRLHASGELEVVGLSLDDADTRAAVEPLLAELDVGYPVHLLPVEQLARLARRPQELGLPFSLLLDAEGRAQAIVSGWSSATRERLGRLTQTLAGENEGAHEP